MTVGQASPLIKTTNGQVVTVGSRGPVMTASRPQPTIIRTSAQPGGTVIQASPRTPGTVPAGTAIRTSVGQAGTVIRTVNGQLPSGVRLVAKTVAQSPAQSGVNVRPQMVMAGQQPGTPVSSKGGQKIIKVSPHVNAEGKKMYTITHLPPGAVIQGNKVILPSKTGQNSTTVASPLARAQTLPANVPTTVRTVTPGSTVPKLVVTPKIVTSSQTNNSPQIVRSIAPVRPAAGPPQRVIMTGGSISNIPTSVLHSDVPTPVKKTELTNKDVAKLWINDDVKLRRANTAPMQVSDHQISFI